MPVRRRRQKRHAGLEAWRVFLETGSDFFQDLEAVGVKVPVPRDAARAAWRQYREKLLAIWDVDRYPPIRPTWAEREFEDASTETDR